MSEELLYLDAYIHICTYGMQLAAQKYKIQHAKPPTDLEQNKTRTTQRNNKAKKKLKLHQEPVYTARYLSCGFHVELHSHHVLTL